jgi:hypothetical protein
MARVSKRFVDDTLWPEFVEISDTLENYLSDVTDRVVSQVIHQDSSDAEVVDDPSQLPSGKVPPPPAPEPERSATATGSTRTNTAAPPSSSSNQSSKNRKKRKRKKRKDR